MNVDEAIGIYWVKKRFFIFQKTFIKMYVYYTYIKMPYQSMLDKTYNTRMSRWLLKYKS